MKKWKQGVLACFCALGLGVTTAGASVETGVIEGPNMSLKYPIVHAENAVAQQAINSNIQTYVALAQARAAQVQDESQSYEVTYEDSRYVSLILTTYEYTGGAHGNYRQDGLVYDKTTGERVPLSFFVRIPSAASLLQAVENEQVKVYSQTLRQQVFLGKNPWKTFPYLSDNYYLAGNGVIYLIYQPYELDAYAAGATRVELTPAAMAYFNGLGK